MKQILVEYLPFNYTPSNINEGAGGSDKFVVSGVLQRAGVKNQNGRIYPKPILEREVERYKSTEIRERRALGELDHPDSGEVNLRNVSHNVLNVEWKGDDLYGEVEVLNTPSGNILKELFRSGITLGISSRGMGSVQQIDENTVEVQDDFQLVCWDFVSNPSTHGAFMSPSGMGGGSGISAVHESVNRGVDSNSKYDKAHNLIRDIVCELSGVCCIK